MSQLEHIDAFPSPFSYVEEAYDLLYEGLSEFISNKEEHFNNHNVDFLEVINSRIKYGLETRGDDSMIASYLKDVESKVYDMLSSKFEEDFPGDNFYLEGASLKPLANAIYYNLIFYKRQNLCTFIKNEVFRNRQTLATSTSQRDFNVELLKTEFKFKNPAYCNIVGDYQNIVSGILGGEVDINRYLENIDINSTDLELLQTYFENSNTKELFSNMVSGYSSLDSYYDFLYEVKLELIDTLKDLE